MKIIQLITRLNLAGPAIIIRDLSRQLIKDGHKVIILAGQTEDNEQEGLLSNNIITISNLKRSINLWQDYKAFKEIRKILKQIKPDILHTHTSKAGFIGRLAAISLWNKPKLIHHFHGHVFHSYFLKTKTFLFKKIEKFLAKYTDVIIVISEQQKKEIEQVIKKETILIRNGFHLKRFLENYSKQRNPRCTYIGIVARLTLIKNLHYFLDIIEGLDNKQKNRYRGYIVGEGELKEELKKEIKNRKLPVYFWDTIEYRNMPEMYKQWHIVLCTSLNEGTPTSIIEAMASGCLTLSTYIGGCVDFIRKGCCYGLSGNGIKTDVNLIHYLVQSENKEIRDYVRRTARDYVRCNHSFDWFYDEYKKVLKKLME